MKRFFKKNIISISLLFAVYIFCLFVFENVYSYASEWRGYDSIGGEIFVFAIPLIVWVVYRNIKDSKRGTKK